MATATQLTLYNAALLLIEQSILSDVEEANEARRVLDLFYQDKDARKECLEMGNWNFATRTVKITFNSDIDPDFGLQRAFTKPTDWARTTEISSDEYFYTPMTDRQYKDEQGYFRADEAEVRGRAQERKIEGCPARGRQVPARDRLAVSPSQSPRNTKRPRQPHKLHGVAHG